MGFSARRPLLAAIVLAAPALTGLSACVAPNGAPRPEHAAAPAVPPAATGARPARKAPPAAAPGVEQAAGAEQAAEIQADPPVLSPDNVVVGARQSGPAHWYGGRHSGRPTASGEVMNHRAFTAAHPYLPFGSVVRVTNRANGRSVEVKVNDRMSSRSPAVIDLTPRAAVRIGTELSGANTVDVEVVSLPDS